VPITTQLNYRKWNEWLDKRYPTVPSWLRPGTSRKFSERHRPFTRRSRLHAPGVYVGHNSLKTYDFYLFAQDVFSQWCMTCGRLSEPPGRSSW